MRDSATGTECPGRTHQTGHVRLGRAPSPDLVRNGGGCTLDNVRNRIRPFPPTRKRERPRHISTPLSGFAPMPELPSKPEPVPSEKERRRALTWLDDLGFALKLTAVVALVVAGACALILL